MWWRLRFLYGKSTGESLTLERFAVQQLFNQSCVFLYTVVQKGKVRGVWSSLWWWPDGESDWLGQIVLCQKVFQFDLVNGTVEIGNVNNEWCGHVWMFVLGLGFLFLGFWFFGFSLGFLGFVQGVF